MDDEATISGLELAVTELCGASTEFVRGPLIAALVEAGGSLNEIKALADSSASVTLSAADLLDLVEAVRAHERASAAFLHAHHRATMPEGERDQLDFAWNEPGAPFRSSDY